MSFPCSLVTECPAENSGHKSIKIFEWSKTNSLNHNDSLSLQVVTSAPNLSVGARVVVATVGTKVDAGGESVTIKKQAVGDVMSEVCWQKHANR